MRFAGHEEDDSRLTEEKSVKALGHLRLLVHGQGECYAGMSAPFEKVGSHCCVGPFYVWLEEAEGLNLIAQLGHAPIKVLV